jgi:hypothetical protein
MTGMIIRQLAFFFHREVVLQKHIQKLEAEIESNQRDTNAIIAAAVAAAAESATNDVRIVAIILSMMFIL